MEFPVYDVEMYASDNVLKELHLFSHVQHKSAISYSESNAFMRVYSFRFSKLTPLQCPI
jgi:hypothetical protein